MKLQINLKLQLAKQKKTIKVSYHTFVTATYDYYLAASLALRSSSAWEAEKYIDDISGNGSLNAHFRSLYEEMMKLSPEELQSVLTNSLVPTLKIDASNWYDYYPPLDISVFKRRVYRGDLGMNPDVIQILHIQEEIVDQEVVTNKEFNKPEPYYVLLTDNNVSLRFFDEWADIPADIFEESLIKEVYDLQGYNGTVYDIADGNGWAVLTNTKLNNLITTSGCFYDEDGNHCVIRNKDVQKTTIALVNGLYIYKETTIDYANNAALCRKVLSVIADNALVRESGTKKLELLLQNVDAESAQAFINYNLGELYFPKEITDIVILCVKKGCNTGWRKSILQEVLRNCDKSFYSTLYRMNDSLNYSIEQLLLLDISILNDTHKAMVIQYQNDLNEMRKSITQIIGEITTSGLRERAKVLKADTDTRRFTKLCNDLIGHVKTDLANASKVKIEEWLKAALELKNLSVIIEKKLKDIK